VKKALWIGASVVVLLAATILVAPALVDLGFFKRSYLPVVEEALHRRVDVGEVRLGLIPAPSIRLSNLKISDSPAFPGNTFFAARQIELRLKFWPLVRGRFEVTEFILEKPVINLLKQPDGTFNYSDLTGKKSPAAKNAETKRKKSAVKSQEPSTLPFLLPSRLRIRDGQLNLETKGQRPLRINGIDLSLQEFADDQPFPYRVSFNYPGLKTVSLEGLLSYQDEQATLKLKDNRIKVHDLVLPVEGSVTHLSTVPRVNLSLSSDPVDAKPVFQVLSVFGLAPADTEVSGPMGLRLAVSGLSNNLATEIRGKFKDVRVDGKRALKGNLNGNVFIRLPLGGGAASRRLQGNGRLTARDGELTNVDLIKKIQRVTGMIGLSKEQGREATTFKTLETDFVVGDGLAVFERIHLVNPQLEVTGGGTMTLEQPALNMAVETTLSRQASTRAGAGRTTTFFKDQEGRIVVPLKITGPVENPAVNLDTEKLAQRGIKGSAEKGAESFFKRLFRR